MQKYISIQAINSIWCVYLEKCSKIITFKYVNHAMNLVLTSANLQWIWSFYNFFTTLLNNLSLLHYCFLKIRLNTSPIPIGLTLGDLLNGLNWQTRSCCKTIVRVIFFFLANDFRSLKVLIRKYIWSLTIIRINL